MHFVAVWNKKHYSGATRKKGTAWITLMTEHKNQIATTKKHII